VARCFKKFDCEFVFRDTMTMLSAPRVTPLIIASLIVVGLLSLFAVSESYNGGARYTHVTTDIAAAAAGARVTPTEPRL
jgi:hypothetical protein